MITCLILNMNDYYKIIDIKFFSRENGSLYALEGNEDVPFDIKRIFYITNMSGDRANHAHYECKQFLISLNGRFDVELINGSKRKIISLDTPNKGLLINPLTWVKIFNFKDNALCLVLNSHHYDENDYINDFQKFMDLSSE